MNRYLIRPRAWWFNKVPLSITLVLLLVDGGPLLWRPLAALAMVSLGVCAAANYGYALNDLYDVEEDVRAARANAAIALGRGRMLAIVIGSAALAELVGALAAGWGGAGLTLVELALPLAYSAPPLRIKTRKWLGVASDALAAHVYPAALAMMAVSHLEVWRVPAPVIACVLAWAAAAGLRGILSHQLHTAERDRQGGLTTVVHDLGRRPLERLIVFGLLPIETAGFIGAAVDCRTGMVLWAAGALYLMCETLKTLDGRFTVTALRPQGQRHLPLLDEAFYKGWGPIVIALDAARMDLSFLLIPLLYAALFQAHLKAEAARLRELGGVLFTPAGSG